MDIKIAEKPKQHGLKFWLPAAIFAFAAFNYQKTKRLLFLLN